MRWIGSIILLLFPLLIWAQDTIPPKKQRKIGILPVPTFGYAPETRIYAGAVALLTLRQWEDSLTRVSTAKVDVSYTQNKQFILELGTNLFTPQEKYNLEAVAGWRRFPEFWWGMGNESPDSVKEKYDAWRIDADLRGTRQIRKHLFVGFRYRAQYLYRVRQATGGILDLQDISGESGGFFSGLGPSVSYDSRRNVLNAREGWYAHGSALAFTPVTGSDLNFVRIEADVRKFIPLRKGKDVLALQAYALMNPGDPPFRLTGMLGGDQNLRGYYQGRYRDANLFTAQAEYRMALFWRLGAAAFVGVGEVVGPQSEVSFSSLKPAAGGGLRLLMDKHDDVNFRIDCAFGRNSFGFYVAFGEAF